MAKCGILLNDNTSFLLLNTGDFYLLNDNSCATEPDGSLGVVVEASDTHTYLVPPRLPYRIRL